MTPDPISAAWIVVIVVTILADDWRVQIAGLAAVVCLVATAA